MNKRKLETDLSNILEFSISNYRSFLKEQLVKMTGEIPRSVTAFFGANSAGKSNTAFALNFMSWFIRNSANANMQEIPYEPFLLNQDSPSEPTSLSITFLQGNKKFEYGFTYNKYQIVEEHMIEFTKKERESSSVIFRREFNEINSTAAKFGFGKQIKEITRPNTLLITKAYENNNEYAKALFSWLDKFNVIVDSQNFELSSNVSFEFFSRNPEYLEIAKDILHDTDFSIRDLVIEEKEIPSDLLNSNLFPEEVKQHIASNQLRAKQVSTVHAVRDNEYNLVGFQNLDLFSQESYGTNKFVKYLGPVIDSLKNGKVLYIDEFGSHLHPDIANAVVKLFKSKKYNKLNAQLIINTHETSLMPNRGALDREDIFIIDKGRSEESIIKPLSNYGVRSQEAIEKRYRGGMFGANQ